MTRFQRALLPIGIGLLVFTNALPAAGQEDSEGSEPASIELRLVIPPNADVPPQFVATVRDAQGNSLPGVMVDFSRELEFLGTKRMASLGTAATDVGGAARLVILPRQEHAIVVASVPGTDVGTRIEALFPDDRVNPFYDPEHEHGVLTPLRTVMPRAIAALVALLWVLVIALAVSTLRRIRQLGEREEGGIG